MADHWYFDCAPCGISEPHDTEDAAIAAAEDHVFAEHRKIPSEVRGAQRIGHVQNRTDNAIGTATPGAEATAERLQALGIDAHATGDKVEVIVPESE